MFVEKPTTLFSIVLFLAAVAPATAQLSCDSDRYHTFDEMTAFLREASRKYPDMITCVCFHQWS